MKNDRSSERASGAARYRSPAGRALVFVCALAGFAGVAGVAFPTPVCAQAASTPLTVKAAAPAPGAALAKAAPPPDPTASPAALAAANQLMSLQEDTVILKAQLKKLEAQADVAARQDALGRMGHAVNADQLGIVATQSLGKTMMATIDVNDGSELDVHAGDQLPNGIRIVSIRPGVVVVDSNGRRSTLTVSSPRQRESRMVAVNGTSSGVPPIPTLPMPAR